MQNKNKTKMPNLRPNRPDGTTSHTTTRKNRKTCGTLTGIHPIGRACMGQGARLSTGTGMVQFLDSQIAPESTLLK